MKALLSLCLGLSLFLMVGALGCQVQFPDDKPYACDTDTDCGGGTYKCVARQGLRGYCCQSTTETCNKLDDDCDGVADNIKAESCYTGPAGTEGKGICDGGTTACANDGTQKCQDEVTPANAESCNGKDDDCDGETDEGFNLQTDAQNCGQCGRACTSPARCEAGQCITPSEQDCSDGADNDGDTFTDCLDRTDCDNRPCGATCVCVAGRRGEGQCSDGVDNDGDNSPDCGDDDCNLKSCGAGCECRLGGKWEITCDDRQSNGDGDNFIDCQDPDCASQVCGTGCECTATGNRAQEVNCSDGVDNDYNVSSPTVPGDGSIDCADSDCTDKSCGVGCLCRYSRKVEANCTDNQDNDGDNAIDCADDDCYNKSCSASGTGCTCRGAKTESNCTDGADNDGDNLTDCADGDCAGTPTSSTLVCFPGGISREGNCGDNQDNDGNGTRDCRSGSADPNCVNGSCAVGCAFVNCVKTESRCDDLIDNDGNGGADCADSDCNGRACRKADNTAGTCNASRQCI